MGKGQSVIELNGKFYDVRTGELVKGKPASAQKPAAMHHTSKPASAAKHAVKIPASKSGKVMDGFTRHANTVRSPHQLAHHAPQKTKTLVRSIVHKPGPTSHISAVAPSLAGNITPAAAADQNTTLGVSPERIARAEKVPKSSFISRFGFMKPVIKKTEVMEVRPEPEPLEHTATVTPAATSFTPAKPRGVKDPLAAAVKYATAHEQPRPKRASLSRRVGKKIGISARTINIGAGTLAALLIVAFIAFQNLPNLEMRVATSQAGISASLPGYQPAGFAIRGPIKSSPGQVTISFHAASDSRAFTITQSTSNWNSSTLLDSFVAVGQRQYQIYQDQGKTIYIYDGSDATWVDGGIWYQIQGNSSLSSDQLLRIADSM